MPCVNYSGIVACNVNPPNGLPRIIQNENGTYEVWAYQPSLGEYAWMTVPASGIPTQTKPTKTKPTSSQCITMPWNNVCVPVSQLGEDEQIGLALEKMQIEKEQAAPKPVQPSAAPTVTEPTPTQSTASVHENKLVYYIIIGIIALVVIGWLA
jgi:hypothetical protein